MTGCYPLRVATLRNRVQTMPCLHRDEITIADALRAAGYTSMAIGKWDLAGHTQKNYQASLVPTHQGFDAFFGTPSSNDVTVTLLRDDAEVEHGADMSTLTRRYTDEATARPRLRFETWRLKNCREISARRGAPRQRPPSTFPS